jgi:hypothetical protein
MGVTVMALAEMDFPAGPLVGQHFTNAYGTVYLWDGEKWTIDAEPLLVVQVPLNFDILSQIRVLLQDTDNTIGQYRYTDAELIANINMGLLEMYRIRPDIFLQLNFQIPLVTTDLSVPWPLEPQYAPSIVYYAVGMAQMRDDEATQDARASSFLGKFTSMLIAAA